MASVGLSNLEPVEILAAVGLSGATVSIQNQSSGSAVLLWTQDAKPVFGTDNPDWILRPFGAATVGGEVKIWAFNGTSSRLGILPQG